MEFLNVSRVMSAIPILILVGTLGGCASVGPEEGDVLESVNLADYLEFCRDVALNGEVYGNPVGSSATTRFRQSDYQIVFADRWYLSFRAKESFYLGGAHGGAQITVGTFDRRTGRRLCVRDFIPAERREAALARLREEVVAQLGGEDQLQGEVTLTENFHVAEDGLHFIFNEYEVACYAAGAIEVVLPFSVLAGEGHVQDQGLKFKVQGSK